jgi:hypothetical protein
LPALLYDAAASRSPAAGGDTDSGAGPFSGAYVEQGFQFSPKLISSKKSISYILFFLVIKYAIFIKIF